MIKMPHRNVTRFFIPLIDVLILLFCIFLLMDFNQEADLAKQDEQIEYRDFSLQRMDEDRRRYLDDLHRIQQELQKLNELNPKLKEVAELVKRIEQLEKERLQALQQGWLFRIIEIDRHDGSLSFEDETRMDQPVIRITDPKRAQVLLEGHVKEAQGRSVFYYFKRSRLSEEDRKTKKLGTRPTKGDVNRYRVWFPKDKVASNLSEYRSE